MSRMFGRRINEFVLSIDSLEADTFDDLLEVINLYVHNHLNITYFSVLEESPINKQRGLKTIWGTREEKSSYTVDKDEGYGSFTAYSFGENKPVWVVSRSKQVLLDAEDLNDLWGGVEQIPDYQTRPEPNIRTMVMHPIRQEGRGVIGVLEFAAERYIEPTPASLEEVCTLAMVISRAYQLFHVRKNHRRNTKSAMEMLKTALSAENWTRLALPQIFVAYAGVDRLEMEAREAHQAVIGTIREVIGEFSNVLEAIFWEDVTVAGNISQQVISDIGDSEFGLCYFSEPDAKGQFIDNANVLFEAGMMQALNKSKGALLRGWLPIREKDSPALPFDIASERILIIERTDGVFDKTAFADTLRQHICTLLDLEKDSIEDSVAR